MSFTGNFVSAQQALAWGLVNHVVPHDELLPFCRQLGHDIATVDRRAVRRVAAGKALRHADPTQPLVIAHPPEQGRIVAQGHECWHVLHPLPDSRLRADCEPGLVQRSAASTACASGPTSESTASSAVASRGSTLDQKTIFCR